MNVRCPACKSEYLLRLEAIPVDGGHLPCPSCSTFIPVNHPRLLDPDQVLVRVDAAEPRDHGQIEQDPGDELSCGLHEDRPAAAVCVGCARLVCESCRNKLGGRNYCDRCARHVFDDLRKALQLVGPDNKRALLRRSPHRDPFLAGLLSLFLPGLGQVYNGQVAKGVGMFFGSIVTWAFMLGWIFSVWSITDAYRTARLQIEDERDDVPGPPPPPQRPPFPQRPTHPVDSPPPQGRSHGPQESLHRPPW